jgi:hypothetical protein
MVLGVPAEREQIISGLKPVNGNNDWWEHRSGE